MNKLIRFLTSAASVGSGVFSMVKVSAIALAVVGVFGFSFIGCQKLMDAGYSKAEADRLEDLAEQNADALKRSKADHAASSEAEKRYRAERDRARAAAMAAIAARRKAEPKDEGKVECPADWYRRCVISR